MSYLFAATHVALAALYLFLASTGRPGMAAWCVSAALAMTLAGFVLLAHSQRGLMHSQRELIESQRGLLCSKDQLIELLVDKAGMRSVFDAAKEEAEEMVSEINACGNVGRGGA